MKKNNNSIRYVVAVPFLSNDYKFSIIRKTGWSIIDYIFIRELIERSMTIDDLSSFSNLQPQVVIQILLPLCNMQWVEILTHKDSFIFRITLAGINAYNSMPKDEYELRYIRENYERRRTVYVDILGNYYGINDFNEYLLTNQQYLKECDNNKNIFTLPLSSNACYPIYEKMYSAIAKPEETIVDVYDQATYLLDTKVYLLVDMLYMDDWKEGRIIDDTKTQKLNSELIKKIKQILPNNVNEGKFIIEPSLVKDNENCRIKTSVAKSEVDFVYGGRSTEYKFIDLIQNASDFLIIHSTFIGEWQILHKDGYSHCFLEIREALKRGVKVYILWGKSNAEEEEDGYEKSNNEDKKIERMLKDFNTSCREDNIFNSINYNDFRRTDSHAKFVITNHSERGLCAMVGSCNFLYTKYDRFEASIIVYDDLFTKSLLEVAADICSGKNFYNSLQRTELRRISSKIKIKKNKVDIVDSEKIEIKLVLKSQHSSYIDLAAQAKKRIYITSDYINTSPIRPIFDALRKSEARKYYYYNKKSPYVEYLEIKEMQEDLKLSDSLATLGSHDSKSHAKVLAWDNNDLLITSLNWLSASAPDNSQDAYHEMGIYVKGWDVAKDFINTFNDL